MGGLSLLQWLFPIQGLNPGLPHCRRILYQLSHKGSPETVWEWLAIKDQVLPLFKTTKEDSTHIMYVCVWEAMVGRVGE